VQSNAHWRAWCLYELRAWEVAFTGFVEATRLAERLGNAAEVGANLYWQGMCLWHRDNPNRDVSHASALFDQSLETANELAEPSWFVAESHWMLALMAEEAKDRIAAKARFRTAAQHYSAASHQYQASALRKVAENSYPEVKPGDYQRGQDRRDHRSLRARVLSQSEVKRARGLGQELRTVECRPEPGRESRRHGLASTLPPTHRLVPRANPVACRRLV